MDPEERRRRRRERKERERLEMEEIETHGPVAPEWAPRLPQKLIARVYQQDATGLHDEALIDEVGCAILARVNSIMTATRAAGGEVTCPMCEQIVRRERNHVEPMICICGWRGTWYAYFKSFQGKQLSAGGMRPFFEAFQVAYPKATGYREKMVLVDQLIHRFHSELNDRPTRAGGVNLIGGKLREVIAFLDTLTYGEHTTPGLRDSKTRWYGILKEKKRV